ncbi:hypothetical protein TSOC_008951 [Tetrabaena socialis]|uniref:Uncharacterized protein n=1 Tax=Tetrabaena socialis TaxID=47790 RepID=A0A2J7ZX67_9CHLO|nr:hypothetical protein TSOC_008951 [Tetrabaena socialis]|eukprot:PNH04871.1 hypothetical protein TSOC_008951 [Tetrabaena socialis]
MSITTWDIKEAAFTSDVREVEELILTNKTWEKMSGIQPAFNVNGPTKVMYCPCFGNLR